MPVTTLSALAETVTVEHPAGIVLIERQSADKIGLEQVWQKTGRNDLPIIRCVVPQKRLVPEQLGVADYLVKPIARDELIAAIGRACPAPSRFLVIDDDPRFGPFVGRLLKAAFPSCRVRQAHSGQAGLAALAQGEYDLILLDLTMPDIDGIQVIEVLHNEAHLSQIPIIVITGASYGEQVARREPIHVELHRRDGCSEAEVGRYVTALLEVAPPDYSRPAPAGEPKASRAASLAS